MINIFDMIDNNAPESQSVGAKPIFKSSGFMVHIDDMDRKQKLSYIEHLYASEGEAAKKSRWIPELKTSHRISFAVFDNCVKYGLYVFNKRNIKK